VWSAGLWIFASSPSSGAGVILVLAAAALVLAAALEGWTRRIYLAGLAAIIAAQQVVTHLVIPDPFDVVRLDPANRLFTLAEGLWILAFATLLVARGRDMAPARLPRAIGLCGLLIWVTVAAAGRWIAFG
jgi:hypothetical protein